MNYSLHEGDCLDLLPLLAENTFDSLVMDPPAGIGFMGKTWDKGGAGWTDWLASVMRECLRVLKPGGHALVWALPRTSHKTATAVEEAGFDIRDVVTHLFGQGFPKSLDVSKAIDKMKGAEREVIGTAQGRWSDNGEGRYNWNMGTDYGTGEIPITAPATSEARQWDGWGTALKPACEFWILARKPLSEKSVAANVLRWGTGGLNIDGCRVGDEEVKTDGRKCGGETIYGGGKGITSEGFQGESHQGRFPANLVCSEPDLLGEAARFFYCPKASRRERNEGCDGLPEKIGGGLNATVHGDSRTGAVTVQQNNHPTVKAIALMRYLCRLVTPPGGTVLDCFCGSGSTGVAALAEGFGFHGVEADPDYFKIAQARLANAVKA